MKAKNLDHFLSDEYQRRPLPQLKDLYKLIQQPGLVSLGGGMPVPEVFPFEDIRARSLKPPFIDGVSAPISPTETNCIETELFKFPKGGPSDDDIELSTALQYAFASGDTRLVDFMKEHVATVHSPKMDDWGLMMSVGNTFAWDAVLRTFTNPGDFVLVEEYSFPSAIENVQTHGCTCVPVRLDEEGIVPEALEAQLRAWKGPLPKILYAIPTGQNPTGSMLSAERRKRIWELASEFDFLIVEDEPYYYLQMPKYERSRTPSSTSTMSPEARRKKFVQSLVPSFLDFDVDGRVIRLDSCSKVMAPGIRLGWIVAQERFIQALTRTAEGSSSKPSGFGQALVYGLLRRWGHDGFLDWLIALQAEYTNRRNICCDALYEYLPAGRYAVDPPDAGMFFWLRMDARQHPAYEELGRDVRAVEERMFRDAVDNGVLLVPGHWCIPAQPDTTNAMVKLQESETTILYRGTFASQDAESLVDGVKRLAKTMEALEEESYVFIHRNC